MAEVAAQLQAMQARRATGASRRRLEALRLLLRMREAAPERNEAVAHRPGRIPQVPPALALDGLQPGLNLFVGPNRAGKSTVAAAIRAAFLERYSTTVADLAPRGNPARVPA